MTAAKARRGLARRMRLEPRQTGRARRLRRRLRKGKAWLMTREESRVMEAMASVSELIVGFHVEPPPEEETGRRSGSRVSEPEQFIGVKAEKKPA